MINIKKLWALLIDLILPRSDLAIEIEKMNPEEFQNKACTAQPLDMEFGEIFPIFKYKDPLVKEAIWQIKYKRNRNIARLMAQILYEKIINELQDKELFLNFTYPIVLAVPISRKRMRERGYNQIEMLIGELKKIDSNRIFEISPEALIKIKETPPQTSIRNKKLRLKNLIGCFKVKKPSLVKDRNIILIDDVMTTGSTLNEARKTLLESGAKKVIAFTLAH